MPEVQVTVDIPEGWELADTRIRAAKKGEWGWLPGFPNPEQWLGPTDTTYNWQATIPTFILRPKPPEYVTAKRKDIEPVLNWLSNYCPLGPHTAAVVAACRAAMEATDAT